MSLLIHPLYPALARCNATTRPVMRVEAVARNADSDRDQRRHRPVRAEVEAQQGKVAGVAAELPGQYGRGAPCARV